jgi:lysozyme
MKTSMRGMLAIINEEAVVLSTYKDSGGVLTIGIGHTAAAGGVIPKDGNRITIIQAFELFRKDLEKFERHVLASVKRSLEQHEFDALVSFDFNTGQIEKGSVDDKIDAGNFDAAMDTLLQYKKAGGATLPGLVKRRANERAMFDSGTYPVVEKIKVYDRYPGPQRLVPLSQIDLPADWYGIPTPDDGAPDIVAHGEQLEPAAPQKPRGLLLALIELLMSIFKRRT